MSESKNVATDGTLYARGSVIFTVFVCASIGVFGQVIQSIAFFLTFVLALACVRLLIRSSVWLLNRICRHCREGLSATSERDAEARGIDATTERLKSTLDNMRRVEEVYVARYAHRRCSSDDVIRMKSLRLQAEIELLRQEKIPKPWAEACGKFLS
ncbi:hypothetical protein LOC71_04950 [Rhodopirellula sp. JC740]|uniref:Uncharacterized protein n=1 Tax=Rhodopirellula halodulae TaxID=2894198 RepID=A0ABS8NDI0_9BACT|nr:hypothetical protein [Rhodopirellula sp. JC740]MCC9641612.1 hypothetical protein [Rhodopirellula sp. JC740]